MISFFRHNNSDNEEQTAKLDKLVPRPKEGNSMQKYFLYITDAIMLNYHLRR